MFDDTLHFLANHLDAPDWNRLGEHLQVEWIEEAVQRTEATSICHRRLSKTVDGVYQEIWGNLNCVEPDPTGDRQGRVGSQMRTDRGKRHPRLPLDPVRTYWAANTRSYGKLPASMKHLRERLVSLLNDERPDRKFDRAVKAKPKRYVTRLVRKTA
jgi:hypothetical protein